MSAETDAIAARLRSTIDQLEVARPSSSSEMWPWTQDVRTLLDEREADKALIAEAARLLKRVRPVVTPYWGDAGRIDSWLAAVEGTT